MHVYCLIGGCNKPHPTINEIINVAGITSFIRRTGNISSYFSCKPNIINPKKYALFCKHINLNCFSWNGQTNETHLMLEHKMWFFYTFVLESLSLLSFFLLYEPFVTDSQCDKLVHFTCLVICEKICNSKKRESIDLWEWFPTEPTSGAETSADNALKNAGLKRSTPH